MELSQKKMLMWIERHKKNLRLINPKKLELNLPGEDFAKGVQYWYDEICTLFTKEMEYAA